MWFELFTSCLDTCAFNIQTLLSKAVFEKQLLSLPDSILREVLERSYRTIFATNRMMQSQLEPLVKFHLKSTSNASSVFELLKLEKVKSIQAYQLEKCTSQDQLHLSKDLPCPLLTWKLENLNLRQNFYRESDQFNT